MRRNGYCRFLHFFPKRRSTATIPTGVIFPAVPNRADVFRGLRSGILCTDAERDRCIDPSFNSDNVISKKGGSVNVTVCRRLHSHLVPNLCVLDGRPCTGVHHLRHFACLRLLKTCPGAVSRFVDLFRSLHLILIRSSRHDVSLNCLPLSSIRLQSEIQQFDRLAFCGFRSAPSREAGEIRVLDHAFSASAP
jgi:hypothetical protein